LANHTGKWAMALGALLISNQVAAHGDHAHGKPLSAMEQKAAEGDFADADVKDRPLSDWDGLWQSVYPLLESGELDPVWQKKAQQDGSKTAQQVKAYYRKGYATNVDTIGIENGVMEFHIGDRVSACRYHYAGHRNMCSSAITPSHRANQPTSIFLWVIVRSKLYWRRWITGRPTIPGR